MRKDKKLLFSVTMGKSETKGWLATNMEDPGFCAVLERVEIIENFLDHVDEEMEKRDISRAELARHLGCQPSDVAQIMWRTLSLEDDND